MTLELTKPLAIIDLETTGIDIVEDRIVQIGVVRIDPPWDVQPARVRLVSPGVPIPAGATEVHGIRDDDVRDAPEFRRIAKGLLDLLEGCDIGGYNVRRFDLPMLVEEFDRVGMTLELDGRRIVDALEIWRAYEPRTLAGAVERFAPETEFEAHDAAEDCKATAEVIQGMARAFVILDVDEAVARVEDGRDAIDLTGRFVWDEQGEARFGFGKHVGRRLVDHVDYLAWMAAQSFPADVRRICREAQRGVFPVREVDRAQR